MNFAQWKKLDKYRQKKIAKSWELRKNEGQEITTAVLKAFIRQYGLNRNIAIDTDVIRLRNDAGWAIGVQCLNAAGLKITPRNYMGIRVSRLYVDNIDDVVFSQFMPQKVVVLPLSRSYKGLIAD